MRIYKLLLIFICLLTSVTLRAQQTPTITLSLKDVPLETVLSHLKKQVGVTFVYNGEMLKKIGKISVSVEKADLQTVLRQIFRNSTFRYVIEGNIVVLTNKKDASGNNKIDSTFFSQGIVQGFVYDTRQEGLNGATVVIKRSRQGTITGAKGEFKLDNVRTNDTLVVSYIGYKTQYTPVSGKKYLYPVLNETNNELDQVVVQAYGTTTKRLAVGSIVQINAKDIENQPVTNPILALQGQVPGMLITPTSGFSGGNVKLEIRGRNRIADAPTDPLYIIDGVPLITPSLTNSSGQNYGSYQGGSNGFQQSGMSGSRGGQSPFFSLNPADIESITILKDAAATAMYGSRAGNGVILITTKKGKPGATTFSMGVDRSMNKTIGQWDMLNTSQYLQMRREALSNDGLIPTIANAPDLMLWDNARYTNWQKELYQNTNNTGVNASLSGGSNQLTFRLSSSYVAIQDLSALTNTNKNQKATVDLNLGYRSANQKLSLSLTASYGYTNTYRVGIGGSSTLPPNAPPIFDEKGNLNYTEWNAAGIGGGYPFATLFQPTTANSYFLNSGLNIGYHLIAGLNISASLGYNNAQFNNNFTSSIASQNPDYRPTGMASFGNNGNIGVSFSPQVTYDRQISKGKLQALIGATMNNATAQGTTTTGQGYTSDYLLKSINNAPYKQFYQSFSENKYLDVHGRLNYSWEDKYVIELTGNRDGSSDFGPGRQFANFWSAGANWIASEEKWLRKPLPTWISLIKFSGTIGTTGNSGGAYQYLSQWATSTAQGGTPLYSYNSSVPFIPIHAVNQNYHWETNRKINVSLELGFLNDRFTLHMGWYKNRTNDQLTELPTAAFTGFTTVKGNSLADVQNTGIESGLNARIIDNKDFSWSASFNISHNANKLLAFPGIQYTPYYTQNVIGKSLNTLYLLHYLGIDPKTGQRAYEDFNHDGIITTIRNSAPGTGLDDGRIAIDPTPTFYGGATTYLRYKKLTLGLLFNFQKKITPAAYTGIPGAMQNVPVTAINNAWQKPGDIAVNPSFTTNISSNSNFGYSDGIYTDGSFIRLQNINFACELPEKLAKAVGATRLSLAVSMQNILTFTKYNGVDPDASFGGQPQAKVINGKIAFTF
jgi:TonB-linked SusC/RagA family outer membrane protein